MSIPAVAAAPLIATDVPALFRQGTLPAFTETIVGDPQEPINLVITARNEAGWLAQGRQPNDKAFQKPTADQILRQRHHVRFWHSGMVTSGGDAIFVGAASFDNGMDWDATDHIAPDVDAERDYLGQDLRQTGLVVSDSKFQAARQRIGQNFNGDPWFTDGGAIILTLSP